MALIDNYVREKNPFIGPNMGWPSLNIQPRRPAAGGQAPQVMPSYARPQFTQNAFTQAQLAGMGGGATPQWMYDAYSNKIGNMGGNANQPPFQITQSGFPGAGGKTAPAQGQ